MNDRREYVNEYFNSLFHQKIPVYLIMFVYLLFFIPEIMGKYSLPVNRFISVIIYFGVFLALVIYDSVLFHRFASQMRSGEFDYNYLVKNLVTRRLINIIQAVYIVLVVMTSFALIKLGYITKLSS